MTAEAPLVDVSRRGPSGNVDSRQMQELPVNGRNWQDLALLAPGARVNSVVQVAGRGNGMQGNYHVNLDGQQVTQNTRGRASGVRTAAVQPGLRSPNSSSSPTGSTRRRGGRRGCRSTRSRSRARTCSRGAPQATSGTIGSGPRTSSSSACSRTRTSSTASRSAARSSATSRISSSTTSTSASRRRSRPTACIRRSTSILSSARTVDMSGLRLDHQFSSRMPLLDARRALRGGDSQRGRRWRGPPSVDRADAEAVGGPDHQHVHAGAEQPIRQRDPGWMARIHLASAVDARGGQIAVPCARVSQDLVGPPGGSAPRLHDRRRQREHAGADGQQHLVDPRRLHALVRPGRPHGREAGRRVSVRRITIFICAASAWASSTRRTGRFPPTSSSCFRSGTTRPPGTSTRSRRSRAGSRWASATSSSTRRGTSWAAWLQDDWAVTPRLTLNLGVGTDVQKASGARITSCCRS